MTDIDRTGGVAPNPATDADPGDAHPLATLRGRMLEAVASAGDRLDPRLVAGILPIVEGMHRAWFNTEVRGLDRLPEHGPVLLVANHSGGMLTPDSTAAVAAWYRANGIDEALYGLAFDFIFAIPGAAGLLRRAGAVPANMANAKRVLERGDSALVYPGGDWEVYRPYWDRAKIDFAGRTGFVRLALETGVPIVPIVSWGGHDTTFVVTRGDRLARTLGLDRIRSKILPFSFVPPFGVIPGFLQMVPYPAKIVIEVGEPIRLTDHVGRDATDRDALDAGYALVTQQMQASLEGLAAEIPFPLVHRAVEAGSSVRRRAVRVLDRARAAATGASAPERPARGFPDPFDPETARRARVKPWAPPRPTTAKRVRTANVIRFRDIRHDAADTAPDGAATANVPTPVGD